MASSIKIGLDLTISFLSRPVETREYTIIAIYGMCMCSDLQLYTLYLSLAFYAVGQIYVFGRIQTERTFECGNKEISSSISIVVHNATLVRFQALIPGQLSCNIIL